VICKGRSIGIGTANRIYVVAAQAREPNSGLVVMPDSFFNVHRAEITLLAARYRLPTVYPYRQFTELGGLLSHGFDRLDNFRRAAGYVDRILKGEKPADLPVQAPTKFELVVNLKTAKTVGAATMTTPNNNYGASNRELQNDELDAVTGGLVVNSIIGIMIGQLNERLNSKPAPEKHWFNGG
jgi:ABC-type uncharacterized transport system substrate-binding protein